MNFIFYLFIFSGSEVYITEEAESSLTNQQTSQPMQECLSVLLKEEEIDDRLEYPVLSCNPNLLTTDSNKLDFEIDSFADVGVLSGFRPCPLCGRAIKDGNCKPLMESHLRQHHRQPLSTPETDGGHSRLNGATTTAVVKKPNWLSCTDCDKYYKTARTLLKHAKLCHHDQRDKLCCISCHIVFQNDSALQTHMRTSHKRSSHLENTSDPSLLMEFGLDPHNSSQIESFDEAKFSSEEDGPLQVESSTGLISPITRPSIDLVNGVEDGEYLSDGGQESCSYPSDLDSSTDKPSVSATSSASVKRKRNLSGPQQQKKKQPRIQVIRTGSTLNVNPIVSCPELSNHVCVRCEPSISFIGKAEYLNHCEREHNLQIFRVTFSSLIPYRF